MQCILVDLPTLGIWTYFETNYAYGNFHYVEIPTVGLSTRMHCVYQNLDNIYCHISQLSELCTSSICIINFFLILTKTMVILMAWFIYNIIYFSINNFNVMISNFFIMLVQVDLFLYIVFSKWSIFDFPAVLWVVFNFLVFLKQISSLKWVATLFFKCPT